ncbi:protein kinase [Acinetobacter baumannii]|uniref:Protein kinase n=1 Tax=Acinetobacter baumannii TaxID=470 RepID=A0AAQ0WL31_ACIBA|nr:serine/threonine-protein kinase [Acinetobacter baumannii]EHU1923912.1 protein kinase [Acinetobacter baumannii]EHU1925648.1 protein kinase [Acinetobacter baumannii]EHU1988671.1 protein kinase [Acinetobacter baumannii]EHU1990320.1 protein kinase [Acinetobacter baumannii]EHU2639246.1 protein kinase [Acinetobacter baumannii]
MLKHDFASHIENLKCVTKPRSDALGRHLWTCTIDADSYWLKFHLPNVHAQSEQDFLHELQFYEDITYKKTNWLLPFKIIEGSAVSQQPQFQGRVLVLPDTDCWFDDLDQKQNLKNINEKIYLALVKLAELHELGWIHGDIKKEHFRKFKQELYLIDFEKTRLISSPDPITDATPRYMAPELFHGANKTVQSDLYALGIVLYEWLTQTRLQANSYHEWAVLHCQKLNVVLPSSFQIFLPLLSGLLQKQQQNRFSNVHEAINCLKALPT